MKTIHDQLYSRLLDIPLADIHTHLDLSHLSARGLHDILLYHMVISDLYSAGCPDGARLPEEPSEEEIEFRIERALPYLRHIQNTSCFWGARTILKDLYEWDQPITKANWKEIHHIIQKKASEPDWPGKILKRAGIGEVCTELWRGHDKQADDRFYYCLEWAFFTRCQWGQYDTALLELEKAWGQDQPGMPLPVTMGERKLELNRQIHSIEDVKEAVAYYCGKIPYDKVISTAQHVSTDIQYRRISDSEMQDALKLRAVAGVKERDIYANYILECFLGELNARKADIVFQFSIGAEPLPLETGCKLKSDTVSQLADIIQRHAGIRFQAMLACEHQNQAMCTIARELPNLSLAGYWWHNFFPGAIRKVIHERLDMLPANKQIGFFSDAYCVDWAYAKASIIRRQLCRVLSSKVEQGQFSVPTAAEVAKQILYETPRTLLKMDRGRSKK